MVVIVSLVTKSCIITVAHILFLFILILSHVISIVVLLLAKLVGLLLPLTHMLTIIVIIHRGSSGLIAIMHVVVVALCVLVAVLSGRPTTEGIILVISLPRTLL